MLAETLTDVRAEEVIRKFIAENLLFTNGDLPIDDDDSFIENGIIDSTGVLELELLVEENFGIDVPDDDVVPENFDSVTKLAAYVRRKQGVDIGPTRVSAQVQDSIPDLKTASLFDAQPQDNEPCTERIIELASVNHDNERTVYSRATGQTNIFAKHIRVLQQGGYKPPLFWMHGARGTVFSYRDLMRYLGPDQPVYGLVAQSLDGSKSPLNRIEDMAAKYANEIRAVQPRGPYYLAGPSAAGVWAFEVAQQLRSIGEEIALLALFDTLCPDFPEPLPTLRMSRILISTFLHLPSHDKWLYGKMKAYKAKVRLKWRMLEALDKIGMIDRFGLRNHLPSGTGRLEMKFEPHLLRAIWRYVPKPYHGEITYFSASETVPDHDPGKLHWNDARPDTRLGWQRVAVGGLEIIKVPGDHNSLLLEPHVQVLARIFKDRLASAQAGSKSA